MKIKNTTIYYYKTNYKERKKLYNDYKFTLENLKCNIITRERIERNFIDLIKLTIKIKLTYEEI